MKVKISHARYQITGFGVFRLHSETPVPTTTVHSTQLYLINEYMYFDLYSEVEMLYYFIGKTNRTEIKI